MEKNNTKIFWVVIALAVVVFGIYSLYSSENDKKEQIRKSEEISQKDKPSLGQIVAILENQVPYVYKYIKSSGSVGQNDLTRDVSFFVVPGADSIDLKRLVFVDNKIGFEFKYTLNSNLSSSYSTMRETTKTKPYVFSAGSRGNEAAAVTTESDKYDVRILMQKTIDDKTKVIVRVQAK